MKMIDSIRRKFLNWTAQRAHFRIQELVGSEDLTSKERFTKIYAESLWSKAGAPYGGTESKSGHGSTLASTQIFRKELGEWLRDNHITSFFDAPCGDFNWARHIDLPPGCTYLGGDIVSETVADCESKYLDLHFSNGSKPKFIEFDITQTEWTQSQVWLCKDCIQHLSQKDILSALSGFARSNSEYMLMTCHIFEGKNSDIRSGDFRLVDLTKEPFNLPAPLHRLNDVPTDNEVRFVGIWTRAQVLQGLSPK